MNPDLRKGAFSRHPVFWFSDGSLVLRVDTVMFNVHRTLLTRHSPFLLSLLSAGSPGSDQTDYIQIDPGRMVSALDFEALLEHLYHDAPLSSDTAFPRIASVVRVTCPNQLHFPRIHDAALRYFADLFPSGPAPFVHPPHLEEALVLANSFNVGSIRKGLYYSLVTSTNFDTEDSASRKENLPEKPRAAPEIEPTASSATPNYVLSGRDSQRCMRLMTHMIDHFSPILFTAPATGHMACTDVFADKWMKLIIEPAMANEGVYKPLETLEGFKSVGWEEAGVCEGCVAEKKDEWSGEQEQMWKAMDAWLEI